MIMKVTESLKEEFQIKPEGVFAPYFYKCKGYLQNLSAPKTEARANAIYALFTKPAPHIYRNDWIVGSIRPLWKKEKSEELTYAKNIVQSFGERSFSQNSDHFSPDYRRVVQGGIPGLFEEIEKSVNTHEGDKERLEYLSAMRKTISGLQGMVKNYIEKAKELKSIKGYDPKKIDFIINNCKVISNHAPETFAQALQLIWFCHVSFNFEERAAMALGRMDQYLYPFYKKDKETGALTDEFTIELLENVFIKIYESHVYKGGDDVVNICIGGTSVNGECEVNELSYLILQAVKNCNVPGPNLSARVSANAPDMFLDECLKVIGTGLGYPALMNDKVNIAALKQYGYEDKDIYDYSMVGCIENFITGKQPPWSDGRFDTPRFFEYLFNHGKGILSPVRLPFRHAGV